MVESALTFYHGTARGIREIFVAIVFLGIGVFVAVGYPHDSTFWRIFLVILGCALAIGAVFKIWQAFYRMTAKGKVAAVVSSSGLSLGSGPHVAWSDIEQVQIYSGGTGGTVSQYLARLFVRVGDLRLVVVVRDQPGESKAEIARTFSGAFERDLRGGVRAFHELAHSVHAEAVKHGVDMRAATLSQPWLAKELGIPWVETERTGRRGA